MEVQATRGLDGEVTHHAQTHARALWAASGYEAVGETFMEAGIEHVRLERGLA